MKTLKWIAVAALAFAFIACCPCRKNKSTASVPLAGSEWKLIQLYGESVESDNYRMTLAVDGTVNGVGDCNRFAGSYALEEGRIKIADNLASTRMFCPNQQREDSFFKMLAAADAYSIDGTRLMLIKNGEVTGIFTPAPATAK